MAYNNGPMYLAVARRLKKNAGAVAGLLGLTFALGCGEGSDPPVTQPGAAGMVGLTSGAQGGTSSASTGGGASSTSGGTPGLTVGSDFELRAEFSGPCSKSSTIDINLGNSAESFVEAAYCQVNGSMPSADVVSMWANQLRTVSYVRRIDVVQQFCNDANRPCPFTFSDPWPTQADLTTPCMRSGTRDMGAVLMFFNDCPGGTNCTTNWANTHAEGMFTVSPLLAFAPATSGIYAPENAGFWRRELLDAAYAGMQFFLLNTYGPDLSTPVDSLAQLTKALDDTGGVMKIGLFDDTSTWGKAGGVFATAPNLSDANAAAQTIYNAKWKPFFTRVPQKYWYLFNGRPLIYFYNAGTLQPPQTSAGAIAALSGLFKADFGVAPFIVVDDGYYDSTMNTVADARFKWDTFQCGATTPNGSCVPGKQMSESNLNGVKLDHYMVKWDPLGRDHPGQIATAADGLYKDETLLKQRLIDSASAQIAVIATWNDMGEGTGVTRNYDYYAGGNWLEPDAFLKDIRSTQCSN
ncbi:MAG TPA: DUF5010 domain-containing protein [Polyangiaceae bacterium]|jgi:hypothetical protein|nr:DUF5010 domain-containing protein [Polyangiaceae bacterium]